MNKKFSEQPSFRENYLEREISIERRKKINALNGNLQKIELAHFLQGMALLDDTKPRRSQRGLRKKPG